MGFSSFRPIVIGILLSVACLGVTGSAQADDYKIGSLAILHPWARPSTGKTGAAYFTIENSGKADDALISVETDVAARAEIHTMTMEDMVMRMRKLDRLSLPGGETAKVAPGGLHVMLIGLKAPLKIGDRFPLRLTFGKAGSIEVSVLVETPEKAGGGMTGMGHMQ